MIFESLHRPPYQFQSLFVFCHGVILPHFGSEAIQLVSTRGHGPWFTSSQLLASNFNRSLFVSHQWGQHPISSSYHSGLRSLCDRHFTSFLFQHEARRIPFKEANFMIVNPWFSTETKQGSGKVAVYHHHSGCKLGKSIGKKHHCYGTDDRPLCQQCARLSELDR